MVIFHSYVSLPEGNPLVNLHYKVSLKPLATWGWCKAQVNTVFFSSRKNSWVKNGNLGMGQNPIPLVNIKIAGKWMFIPLKMVCIRIDP